MDERGYPPMPPPLPPNPDITSHNRYAQYVSDGGMLVHERMNDPSIVYLDAMQNLSLRHGEPPPMNYRAPPIEIHSGRGQFCRFFGTPRGCLKGDSCIYVHSYDTPPPALARSLRKKCPCRFFASRNGCRNGSNCLYLHEGGSDGPLKSERQGSSGSKVQMLPVPVIPPSEPVLTDHLQGPIYAIDVECVATGTGPLDRSVARIAMVDHDCKTLFDRFVKPDKEIVSYLTALTGITEKDLANAGSLKEAVDELKRILPKDAIITGQSIEKDLTWLGLEKDVDYADMFDISHLFRVPKQPVVQINSGEQTEEETPRPQKFRTFSLRHVVRYLLEVNIQDADHNPVVDALYSMKVFLRFRHIHKTPGYLRAIQLTLLNSPRTPSFAELHPIVDGVAMTSSAIGESEEDDEIIAPSVTQWM